MWRLVREGLRFNLPVLVAALTASTIGLASVFTVLALLRVLDSHHAVLLSVRAWPVTLVIASAVAGFIALGLDQGEHRIRLHLMLPIPIVQQALARVLLPVSLLLLGLPAAHATGLLASAVDGGEGAWVGHLMLDVIAVHLLFGYQVVFALKEVIALFDRGRWQPLLGANLVVWVSAEALFCWTFGSLLLRIAWVAGTTVLLMGIDASLFCHRRRYTV